MKKLIASAAIVGATIFGATQVAGASAPTKNHIPRTWSPATETVIATVLEAQPSLAEYDGQCMVDQIKAEFPTSPRAAMRELKKGEDSPRAWKVALSFMTNCDEGVAS